MCAGWGEGWARELKPADFAPQEGSVRVMEEFDLDIFTRMGGHTLDEFRPRLRHLDTGGLRIPYLSPADLILLKKDSWREKDKLDVLAMRVILAREGNQGQTKDYVPTWRGQICKFVLHWCQDLLCCPTMIMSCPKSSTLR